MTEFYSKSAAERQSRRARQSRLAAYAAACVALAACVAMCFFVNTENAGRLLIAVITVSVLGGWAVILLTGLVSRPARAQASHAEGILGGTETVHEGVLTGIGEPFHIPKSIDTVKVRVNENGADTVYDLNTVFLPEMPAPGTRIRFRKTRRFITAAEVNGNE